MRFVWLVDLVSRVFAYLAAFIALTLMSMISFDVARRSLQGQSLGGIVEYGEVGLVMLAFLPLAWAQRRKIHINVDIVALRLPDGVARVIRLAGYLLIFLVLVWMVLASTRIALNSVATGEFRFGVVAVPIWPARIAISASLAALFGQMLIDAINDVRILMGSSPIRSRESVDSGKRLDI